MKVKYIGVYPEVVFKDKIFKRNEWKEIDESMKNIKFPADFEIEGEKNEIKKRFRLKKLEKIKGIGEETIRDLERIYNSEKELLEALKNDKVPLRNDKVEILKKYYKGD